jgi:phosphatidylglycerol lysyltransferase
MRLFRTDDMLPRIIGLTVITYGFIIIAGSFIRQFHAHGRHDIDAVFAVLPLLIGLSYVYLGSLLIRRKYTAWVTAIVLSLFTLAINAVQLHKLSYSGEPDWMSALRFVVPGMVCLLLYVSRSSFRVKSDMVSFRQALQVSTILLLVAFLYGVGGFMLLDRHDFHQEITPTTAVHQTLDQFGLTTNSLVAHSRRSRIFLDSLPVVSFGAIAYAAISFFQPLRLRLASEKSHRMQAEELLRAYPSDIDDYFKLWPNDKHYFFDVTGRAGLAYHVNRGVALVVSDPFGDRKRYAALLVKFQELCFVNDWLASFVHVSDKYRHLYERAGLHLQKIGEEAILDLTHFQGQQTGKDGKYYRQIRNRFVKLGYKVEVIQPSHSPEVLLRLRQISDEWLNKPGREERGFMLGYHDDAYLQSGALALVYDETGTIQGFMNLVPTFEDKLANYDLLRCSQAAPGNCNDFLLLGLIDYLLEQGYTTLNLGLSPLAGLDEPGESKDKSLVDNALRFAYTNGDRFYSFSGLKRFKEKYKPDWEPRYIAYPGGVRNFTRTVAALNRAMKIR